MATNPQYVRLASRVSGGTQVDLNSGWSISGMDVKPFPEDNQTAKAFVLSRMNRGILEAASVAEYEEVQEGTEAIAEIQSARQTSQATRTLIKALGLPTGPTGIQEAQMRAAAQETRRKLQDARGDSDPDGVSATRKRRRELIAKRNGDEVGEDYDELPEDLTSLTNDQLRAELEARGQETGGNKRELVSRLEEALQEEGE